MNAMASQPGSETPREIYSWMTVILLTLAYVYAWVDRSVFGILLESIRIDLKMTDTQISLVGSLGFAICYTTLQLPSGRIADLYNRRNLIAGGILIWSAMTATCGLATNFVELLIGRMGIGLGEATLVPAAYSLICDLFRPTRVARPLALFLTAGPVGGSLSWMLGGAMLVEFSALPFLQTLGGHAFHPWQSVFLVLGAAGFCIAALVTMVREPQRTVGSASDPTGSIRSVIAYVGEAKSFFIPFMIGTALINLTGYGYGTWLPVLFIRSFHWDAGRVGFWLGLTVLIFGTAAPVTGAWIVKVLQRRGDSAAVVRVSAATCGVLLLVSTALPLLPSGEYALWMLAPFQFVVCALGGILPTALLLVAPSRIRGQLAALWLFIGNLVGIGLGPTIFALVTQYVLKDPAALPVSMASVSAVCLLAATVALIVALKPFRRLLLRLHGESNASVPMVQQHQAFRKSPLGG